MAYERHHGPEVLTAPFKKALKLAFRPRNEQSFNFRGGYLSVKLWAGTIGLLTQALSFHTSTSTASWLSPKPDR